MNRRERFYYRLARLTRKWADFFDLLSIGLARKKDCCLHERKLAHNNLPPLTKEQSLAIDEFWKGCKVDKRWIQYFNAIDKNNDGFDVRYLPFGFYFLGVDLNFHRKNDCPALEDKNMFDLLLKDVRQPKTVARVIEGALFDADFRPITFDELAEKCIQEGSVVCKPSVGTHGGNGIAFWHSSDGTDALKTIVEERPNLLIQAVLKQHAAIDAIHAGSINTIRAVTFYTGGRFELLSATLRMGCGSSKVDNVSSGGMHCGIDETGRLRKYGYDSLGNPCTEHADGFEFEGYEIPGYQEVVDLSCKLSNRFLRVSKLIFWDWAIGEDGHPVFIESNLVNGGLSSCQIANGPLFGEHTKDIVRQVSQNKKLSKMMRLLSCR